jgi:hypothetical protein
MGEEAFGGAEEVWAAGLGSEGDNDRGGVGECHACRDGGPAGEGWALAGGRCGDVGR